MKKPVRKQTRWLLHGACERLNYGDLLFPIIFTRILTQVFVVNPENIFTTGVSSFDGSFYGGLPVNSFQDTLAHIHQQNAGFNFVGLGGETGHCSYATATKMLVPASLRHLFDEAITDNSFHSTTSRTLQLAYIPQWEENLLRPDWTFYNSIGLTEARNLSEPEKLIRSLHLADNVCVRDKNSLAYLRAHQIHGEISPDSAVLLSWLCQPVLPYLRAELNKRHSLFYSNQPYVAIQISNNVLKMYGVERIKQFILQCARETGLTPVLFAAGWAAYHEDHLAIASLLQDEELKEQVIAFTDPNIWMTCTLIAQASLFAGTSLHGRITALSFGVPRLSLDSGDQKIRAWIESWEPSLIHSLFPLTGEQAIPALKSLRGEEGLSEILATKYIQRLIDILTSPTGPLVGDQLAPREREMLREMIALDETMFEGARLRSDFFTHPLFALNQEPFDAELQYELAVTRHNPHENDLFSLEESVMHPEQLDALCNRLAIRLNQLHVVPQNQVSRLREMMEGFSAQILQKHEQDLARQNQTIESLTVRQRELLREKEQANESLKQGRLELGQQQERIAELTEQLARLDQQHRLANSARATQSQLLSGLEQRLRHSMATLSQLQPESEAGQNTSAGNQPETRLDEQLAQHLAGLHTALEHSLFEREIQKTLIQRLQNEYLTLQHTVQKAAAPELEALKQRLAQTETDLAQARTQSLNLHHETARWQTTATQQEGELRRLRLQISSADRDRYNLHHQLEKNQQYTQSILQSRGWQWAQKVRGYLGRAW